MTTKQDAIKLALEALKAASPKVKLYAIETHKKIDEAIAALSAITEAPHQPSQERDATISDTDRLNYVENNFHCIGFTQITDGWIVYHEKDRHRVSSMREAIDIMVTLEKCMQSQAKQSDGSDK